MSDTGDTSRTNSQMMSESGVLIVDHAVIRDAVQKHLQEKWPLVSVYGVMWVPNRDRSMPAYLNGHFQIDLQWPEPATMADLSPQKGSASIATAAEWRKQVE